MAAANERQGVLARGAAAVVVIAVFGLIAAVPVVADPPTTQGQVTAPSAEVEINYFRRAGDENLVLGTAALPGPNGLIPPPPEMRTITVDAGSAVLFQWQFRTRHAIRVTAAIQYGEETISLMPGSPQPSTDGWTKYVNQRNVTIRVAGVYTFRVVVVPGGASAEKSIRVNVVSADIETLEPHVDAATRRVTFRARNNGDADAVGRFTVRYQIQGRNPMRPLVESSLQTNSVTLAPHSSMDLGHVDLAEEAWQSAQLWMRVQTGLMGRASSGDASRDFTYSWPTRELRITVDQLHALGEILTGDILIHNYSNPGADVVDPVPYVTNASHINLMGQNLPFTFDRIIYKVAGVEHYFFVNNFSAPLGGPTFLSIENGKLVLRANFDCGRTDREVKGWTRDWVAKRYVDNTTPDVDIQRFNLAISLTPTLRGGKFSYSDVSLAVDSAMRFPDGWAWLNGFKGWMNDEVQKSVRSNFASMFNRGAIKTTIEDRLTEIVMALGSTMGIHDLLSVRGSGNQIIVAYR